LTGRPVALARSQTAGLFAGRRVAAQAAETDTEVVSAASDSGFVGDSATAREALMSGLALA